MSLDVSADRGSVEARNGESARMGLTMPEQFGSRRDPIKVKCLSFGRPEPASPYLCIAAEDGRQFTFSLGLPAVKLIRTQAQEIEEGWVNDV